MIKTRTGAVGLGLAAFGAALIMAPAPVRAQDLPTSADKPDETLSAHLRMLADNPQSLTALMGAGRAALDLGDAQAALTFFGRAEELAPTDGRIKMWMASALVQMEQPATALKFFDDARRLGVPEADLARDRGLAYDMSGNPSQAQHDYRLVLAQGSDPEVTRRLALSLAISGKKEPALALLEGQLRQQVRAAWRTRAFVLALTGDVEGAKRAAQSVMPSAQAAAMAPFFARLPMLNPAERAMAVHFGRISGDGRPSMAAAPTPVSSSSGAAAMEAGKPDSREPTLGQRAEASADLSDRARLPREPRRRGVAAAAVSRRSAESRPPAKATPSLTSAAQPEAPPQATAPVESARLQDQPPGPVTRPRPSVLPPGKVAQPDFPESPAVAANDEMGDSENILALPEAKRPAAIPVSAEPVVPTTQITVTPAPAPPAGLADIAAAIAALKEESVVSLPMAGQAAQPAEARSRRASNAAVPAKAQAKAPPKPKAAAPRAPARHWVQVAGGASKTALPREFTRLKAKAPALLGRQAAWTTPLNATNRLLVGPFDSQEEAQDFVNALKKADVAAFSWTSAAGQAIEKLPAK
ncbi:SPOR domain-containing protein [Sphingosinicella rhizophila]|uniref:SPOR domain-containing protein n=1 Tax=Sphingosinicella rhizophila TaxID=3050082 RepID=A0ABU3Q3R5_9SPHN|nr:SPOR domain-containing protein [Sphingosinicella sp. GR2756]MDT9598050.1 SPOR domain-containing protein [Sphingosinicella sp. GR2756]